MPQTHSPADGLNAGLADALRGHLAASTLRTQKRLAEAAGISVETLGRLLRYERHIDVAVLERLAAALGTTSTELMAEAEKRAARGIGRQRKGPGD